MKNKLILILTIIISIFMFIPNTQALSKDYIDKVHEYTKTKVEEDIINIYFFRGEGCPHCAAEEEFFENYDGTTFSDEIIPEEKIW